MSARRWVLAGAAVMTLCSAVAHAGRFGCDKDLGCPSDPSGANCADSLDRLHRDMWAKQHPQGVAIGMTAEEVKTTTSWGTPCSVNRTITATGERQKWVYPDGEGFLYFEGGRLVTIQTGGSP